MASECEGNWVAIPQRLVRAVAATGAHLKRATHIGVLKVRPRARARVESAGIPWGKQRPTHVLTHLG
eukprot:9471202-Pyramimonas_sp.AAC.1